jgi:hypothetical protein
LAEFYIEAPGREFVSKIWFLAAFASLAIALAACGGGSDKNKGVLSSSSSGSTPSAGGTTASGSGSSSGSTASGDATPVNDALQNLTKQKSFKGKLNVEGGQFKGDGTIEAVLPDKFHVSFGGGALGNLELISIGDSTYTKTGSSWTKSAGGSSGIGIDPASLTKQVQDVSKTAKITKGGTDKVNNKSCQIYTLDDSQTKSNTEVCIADNLPQRLVASGAGSKVTVTFSDFNSSIDIKAPI